MAAQKIIDFSDYRSRLDVAISAMKKLVATYPEETELQCIEAQLEQLRTWTLGGQAPTLAEKGQLNFGAIASRDLHQLDSDLANELYEIADHVTYWK